MRSFSRLRIRVVDAAGALELAFVAAVERERRDEHRAPAVRAERPSHFELSFGSLVNLVSAVVLGELVARPVFHGERDELCVRREEFAQRSRTGDWVTSASGFAEHLASRHRVRLILHVVFDCTDVVL